MQLAEVIERAALVSGHLCVFQAAVIKLPSEAQAAHL